MFWAPIMNPPAARMRIDNAPSTVVTNSSARPPLIEVMPVENELSCAPPNVPMFPPTTPAVSCATCAARRPLKGVAAICSALTVRAITAVSIVVDAPWTVTVSVSAPTCSWTSTRMLTPAFTSTPVLVNPLNPDNPALTV